MEDRGSADAATFAEARHRPVFFTAPSEQRQHREWPTYTLEQVAQHASKSDCWIVVNDKVYDMTQHVMTHEGWIGSGKTSTLIAVLCAMGLDCTDDVVESHDRHAMRQIDLFQIGVLDKPNNVGSKRVPFLLWEELEAAGFDAAAARQRKQLEQQGATNASLRPASGDNEHGSNPLVQEWREV